MSGKKIDSPAAAAAARRAAAEKARREAEAAAAEARRVAAAAAAQRAKLKPARDELSTGRGSSAVRRNLSVTGASQAPAQLQSDAPVLRLSDVQRSSGTGSPDSIDRPRASPTTTGTSPSRQYGSADAAEQSTAAAAERLDAAKETFSTAVADEEPLAAAEQLTETLEGLPENQRGEFLADSADDLEQLTENLTDLDKGETEEVIAELSRAADVAGPLYAEELTRPIARAIADGRLEQTGDDANGGPGGIFGGANTHNSEREFVDGISELDEGTLFRDSLAASLQAESQASSGDRADRALGFAGAVATGESDQVPDDGNWTKVRELGQDVLSVVDEAAQRVNDAREWAGDQLFDATLGISDGIEALEPGDTLTIGAGGHISAELHGEFDNELQVTRNEDGTFTLKASSSVLAGIGAADNKVAGGGGATVEFTFDNEEEAIDGAQGLAKLALTGAFPVAAPISLPSPEEVVNLAQSISAIQLNGEAAAGLDARFGLSGVQGAGAEGSANAALGARIEFENGVPSAVVMQYEVNVDATGEVSNLLQRLAPGALDDLQGTVEAEGTATVQLRTPLDFTPVEGGNPLEQVQALLEDNTGPAGEPTASVTFTGTAQANEHGVEGTWTAEDVTLEQAGDFLESATGGDLGGALDALDPETEWRTFEDDPRNWLNHGLDIAVASLEAQNVVRHYDEPH